MGMYTEASISINLKAVQRAANAYGLPRPAYINDWMAQLDLAEVKQYCDVASEIRHGVHTRVLCVDRDALELLDIATVLEAQAVHYLYEGLAAQAGLDHKAGLKLLRKRSRAFRITFV